MEGAWGQPKQGDSQGGRRGGERASAGASHAASQKPASPTGSNPARRGRPEGKGTAEEAAAGGRSAGADSRQLSGASDDESPDTSSINTELVNPAGSNSVVGREGSSWSGRVDSRAWDACVEEATASLGGVSVSERVGSGGTRTPPVMQAASAEPMVGRRGHVSSTFRERGSQVPHQGVLASSGGRGQQEADLNGEGSEDDSSSSEQVSGSEEDEDGEDMSWISWFVGLKGNEFFCEVEEEYIQDDFNLTGLSSLVPYYDYAMDMVLDVELPLDTLTEAQQEVVESAAEMLYGLIHARYILTSRGMQAMHEKYLNAHFGRCPRVYCQMQSVLPVGLSDNPRVSTVNVYCPKCQDIFVPRSMRQASLDGAYFGSTFAHLFLLTHPELCTPKPDQSYVPRIYGFRINKESSYYKAAAEAERQSSSRDRRGGSASRASGGGGAGAGGVTSGSSSKANKALADRRLSR